jgi:hypothetical protein
VARGGLLAAVLLPLLRVEHLPEGRRDGAQPRTHAGRLASFSILAASLSSNPNPMDQYFLSVCLNFFFACMRTSWCAEACAPIYVPMARGERSKLKTDLRREKGVWREKWRKMHGGQDPEDKIGAGARWCRGRNGN